MSRQSTSVTESVGRNRNSVMQIIHNAMQTGGCDLHLHTHHSDGSNSTHQLVDRIIESGLHVFSITDHDTMAAIKEAQAYLDSLSLSKLQKPLLIPGVELSVEMDGFERHLLGYFSPGQVNPLEDYLQLQRAVRQDRNRRMIVKLQEIGYPITYDELEESGLDSTGRVQAAILLRDNGYVNSIQEAFDQLLGEGKPAYVSRERPDIGSAIDAIQRAGGVAVLAHPAQYGWCSGHTVVSHKLLKALTKLRSLGLDGVEVYHGETSPAAQLQIEAAGFALQLLMTAGSDDHGINKSRQLLYQATSHWPDRNIMVVVGALNTRKNAAGNQEYLLFQRQAHGRHAGLWELPGGKVEQGETPEEALTRELKEELGLTVKPGLLQTVLYHDYPNERVILLVYDTHFDENAITLHAHQQKMWISSEHVPKWPLLPADQVLFDMINQKDSRFD